MTCPWGLGGKWLLSALGTLFAVVPAEAQNRGVYPLGMTATGSGLMPRAGFTYANQLLVYARDRAKDDDGNSLPVTGEHLVIMDMNTLTWVSPWRILGAIYCASATIPIAKNSLTSDVTGHISGGSGLADSYYLPAILSWKQERVAARAMYGFLAPTGRFEAGADDNVGSGYWTHTLSSGQTVYLTRDQTFTLSGFEMLEFHTTQEDTHVQPGDTFNFDYSLMVSLARSETLGIQAGLVGYEQRQISKKTGPSITEEESSARYGINSLGIAVQSAFPKQEANLALKYFKEFANRSSYEGYSVQLFGAITF